MSRANFNIVENNVKKVLQSYNTFVAYHDKMEDVYYVTEKKHSRTTTKHINQFLPGGANIIFVPQEELDHVLDEGV